MKIIKKILDILARVAVFLISWFSTLLAVIICTPTSDDGTISSASAIAILILPVAVGCFSISPKVWARLKASMNKRQSNAAASAPAITPAETAPEHPKPSSGTCEEEKITIPFTKKKQTEMAESVLSNIKMCVSLANKTTKVSLFVDWYDEAIDGFSTLMELTKVKFKSSPSLDYYRFKDEFQWHLCDAIARAKDNAISEIKNKYRNSREFQIRVVNSFESDIDDVRDRFSTGTADFADAAIAEVRKVAGADSQYVTLSRSENYIDEFAEYGNPDAVLLSVDLMEGHEFEHWCAALLERIGYTDVRVTRGSGDQGVDVLAQKDGIKYAVQCKCYSSDLGNTPVQEILAGKKFYHCHVGAVMTNRQFTKGAKELAAETGILLWDRDFLRSQLLRCSPTQASQIEATPARKHALLIDATNADLEQLYLEAVKTVLETQQASVSMLQRRMQIGYEQATRLMDMMEERKVVGPFNGSTPRKILIMPHK